MAYTIDRISEVAIDVRTDDGHLFNISLEESQQVPQEFKEGQEIDIANRPAHPAAIAMGMNSGCYEITHIASGKVFKAWHRTGEWKVKI